MISMSRVFVKPGSMLLMVFLLKVLGMVDMIFFMPIERTNRVVVLQLSLRSLFEQNLLMLVVLNINL